MKLVTDHYQKLSKIAIFSGIIFRLKHYFENCSFWVDEAAIALPIINRNSRDIILGIGNVTEGFPTAPIGFLLTEKGIINLFPNCEYSLRLFPLICSIISLGLFYKLIKNYWGNSLRTLIALTFFVLADPLIYYAAELKPYSCDVMFTAMLLLFSNYLYKKDSTPRQLLFFGILCAVVIWFSYPAVFVVAGIGLNIMFFCLKQNNKKKLLYFLCSSIMIFTSFIILYKIELNAIDQNNFYLKWWSGGFMPIDSSLIDSLLWVRNVALEMFRSVVGLYFTALAFSLFMVGIISFYSQDKKAMFILISPLLIVFTAAIINRYPFKGRMILFLAPILCIFLTEGIYRISSYFRKYFLWTSVTLLFLLLFYPITLQIKKFLYPTHKKEEMREVVEYLKVHYSPGDSVYLNTAAQNTFGYYHGYFDMGNQPMLVGKIIYNVSKEINTVLIRHVYFNFNDQGYLNGYRKEENYKLLADLRSFKDNPRTWIIFSHYSEKRTQWLLDYLNKKGHKMDEFIQEGAAVYLYNLSPL
ncbi:MAG: glycosyltransferase family 39 protein [Candidatus Omnitrophica bacterium]|nr:glycosyltransferase family 39 protein [Candidatus Omnitrophota bacterium]